LPQESSVAQQAIDISWTKSVSLTAKSSGSSYQTRLPVQANLQSFGTTGNKSAENQKSYSLGYFFS